MALPLKDGGNKWKKKQLFLLQRLHIFVSHLIQNVMSHLNDSHLV